MVNLEVLCDVYGSRFSGLPGDEAAVRFIIDKLESYGCMNVHAEEFTIPGWRRGPATLEIVNPIKKSFDVISLPHSLEGEVEGVDETFYTDLLTGRLKQLYSARSPKSFHFPYAERDMADILSNRSIYYESSRGCPFSCSYCLSSTDTTLRNKDIDSVKEELAWMLQYQPKIIRFVDRTFNASSHRALTLWKFLADQSGDTTFHFEIAPDLFTEEIFSFLETVRPNVFQFEIGIQSTHKPTLNAIHRKMDVAASRANIKRLMEFNTIHLHVDLILGLPYETEVSFTRSFNDMFTLLPHYIQMGLLKILPHTPLSKQTEEFAISYCAHPPYQVLMTKWMDHRLLTRLYWFGECVESFYNNRFFRAFFSYIQRKEEGYAFFSALLEICFSHDFFHKARTQKYMCTILVEMTSGWNDSEIIREILKYDWLRTGNRFLPDQLKDEPLKKEKDRLWQTLPLDYPPYYSRQSRNTFFKQSVFATFSQETLREIGLVDGSRRTVCFSEKRENNVLQLQKTFLIC